MSIASRILLRPDYGANSQRAAVTLTRCAICHLVAQIKRERAEDVAREFYPRDADVGLVLKAAVSPASLTSTGALGLTTVADFVAALGASSAAAAVLGRGMQLEFAGASGILVPGIVVSPNSAAFVQEGGPIPVEALLFDGPVLSPRKLASIASFTRETFSFSTPTIEAMVKAVLSESANLSLDTALFSTTAGDATRPPGLRFGIRRKNRERGDRSARSNDGRHLNVDQRGRAGCRK